MANASATRSASSGDHIPSMERIPLSARTFDENRPPIVDPTTKPHRNVWCKPVVQKKPPNGGYALVTRYSQALTPNYNDRSHQKNFTTAPFKSPITLCFERMLGAGKFRF